MLSPRGIYMVMERTTFLGHYRISVKNNGEPRRIGRAGATTTYKAIDERSGDTVVLTLIPADSIDPSTQEQFEEQARAAQRLRHINIAKVFDFGREDENFVYVSEYLPGETLAAWVDRHGPMPSDAVLRVAEQIVSVLSTARFHKLTHCAIQPSNLMIVPGSTPEGTWPFVKLMNFGLAGLKSGGELDKPNDGDDHEEEFSLAPQFASPEQIQQGTVDFRSEVYSLGATMYFLLTGAARSPETRKLSRQLRVFPKALRNLLAQMLRRNPDQRPKDPVALAEMIRECLLKIERRQALAERYGIPFRTTLPRAAERRATPLLRRALAVGALVLAAALVAGVLLQEPINRIWQRYHEPRKIGVLVGVPESSPTPAVQNTSTPVAPATVLSEAAKAALAFANQPPVSGSTATNSGQASSPEVQQGQTLNAQSEATAPNANSPGETSNSPATAGQNFAQGEDQSSAQANAVPQPAITSQSSSGSKTKRVPSISQRRVGSLRARMVGITSDGRLIYRLPSGRTRIVAPDSDQNEFVPRRHRRAFIEHDETLAPQPGFGPDSFPYD